MSDSSRAVPLSAPYYGASIGESFRRFWKKYATFSGRASRSEYWWWALISVLIGFALQIAETIAFPGMNLQGPVTDPSPFTSTGILSLLWGLATIIPNLALVVRRLHDVNLSAWLLLLILVPFAGAIALVVLTILRSNPIGARFDAPGPFGSWRSDAGTARR